MAASSNDSVSVTELPAFDDALHDLDLRETISIKTSALATSSPLTAVISVPVPAAPVAMPTSLTVLQVFYGSVKNAHADELRATAARIRERDRAWRVSIIETGNDLIKIKDSIPGHFDRCLKLEFDMSKATAWNYINTALEFGDTPKVVEILPPSTAYRLAAKTTPAEVRKAIVLEIESGKVPTKQDVEQRIVDARNRAAEEEHARKLASRLDAEAERKTSEDEQAWQAEAKELADAGKTDAEINRERQKWDTAIARKERVKEARVVANRNQEENRRRAAEERQVLRERELRTAHSLIDLLREHLGEKFETFRSMMGVADAWEFKQAIAAAPSEVSNKA